MPEPQRSERSDGIDIVLAQFVITAVVIVLVAPALVVAAPLAMAIDKGGWRRWPALVAGAATVPVAVALGAWDTYWSTWASVWNAIRFDYPFHPTELFGLVPLAATAGLALGPVLQAGLHHRNEHEATRHHRELSESRRARAQAERAMTGTELPAPADRTVLGLRLDGSIDGWELHRRMRRVVAPPAEVWGRQALILGETGSGKTVTALRLASELLRVGWDVHWIDGKADPGTRGAFLAAAAAAGVDARNGSEEAIDGWRGGPEAVVNRLLATQEFTEPYYEGIARSVLRIAVGDQAPAALTELVDRIDRKLMARVVSGDPRMSDPTPPDPRPGAVWRTSPLRRHRLGRRRLP